MSIRTYIFALLTSFVLLIAVIFSYQSGRLFIGAFEMSIGEAMRDISKEYPQNGQEEQIVLDFHVTTNWQKVPKPVRDRFPVIPRKKNVHHSIFEDWIYIAPPGRAYSLFVTERENELIFVSRFNENIHDEMAVEHKGDFFIDPMLIIILVGVSGICVFILVLLYTFKKIAVPMESLQEWGKRLKLADLGKERPDFRFKELNDLAVLIHNNLASVADSVEREQAFLSYASHELRTPIAVMRSNSALLEKVNPTPSEKERVIRDRIQRASLTMKSMTETLLWLSREGDVEMQIETTSLGALVDSTQSQLTYLLAGKTVEVRLDIDKTEVPLAITPSMIVLNNLIRNAFQHTQQGYVDITQRGLEVTIINVESLPEDVNEVKDELGFGLGMQLVEKLTEQFGWHLAITKNNETYQVSISFIS